MTVEHLLAAVAAAVVIALTVRAFRGAARNLAAVVAEDDADLEAIARVLFPERFHTPHDRTESR